MKGACYRAAPTCLIQGKAIEGVGMNLVLITLQIAVLLALLFAYDRR
jgi:hypothetical protein